MSGHTHDEEDPRDHAVKEAGEGRLHAKGGGACFLTGTPTEPGHRSGLDVENIVSHIAASNEPLLYI
eukprot:6969988-Pyramimonas_sp.AAC.1